MRTGGRRGNHGAIPVLNQLSVPDAERVERVDFIKPTRLRGRILPIGLVNHGHQVAFGGDDFQHISLGRTRPIRCSPASAPACASREGVLEFLVIADFLLLGTLLECGIVLNVARIGKRHTVGAGRKNSSTTFLFAASSSGVAEHPGAGFAGAALWPMTGSIVRMVKAKNESFTISS